MSCWIVLASATPLTITFSESLSLSTFLPNLPEPNRLIGGRYHEEKKELLTRDGVELRGAMLMSSLHLGGDLLTKEEGLSAEDGEGVSCRPAAGGDTGDSAPFWKEPNSEKRNGEALPGLVGVTQRGFWFG